MDTNQMNGKMLMDIKGMSSACDVSSKTIKAWTRREKDPLPCLRIGRKYLFPIAQVNDWIRRQANDTEALQA